MSEEQNKMIVRQFIEEMWNQRKLHLADELFAPDCITHQLRSEEDAVGMPRSPESVKREAAVWLSGFPDLKFVLEKIAAATIFARAHCVSMRWLQRMVRPH